MITLAWLLVIALFILAGFVAYGSIMEVRSAPARWLHGAVAAGGAFFGVIAVLLLWQTLMHSMGATGPKLEAVREAQAAEARLAPPHDPFAAQGPAIPREGRRVYLDSGCHRCHSIGAGPLLGPDLVDAASKYDEAFLIRWILDPDGIYKELGVTVVNPGYTPMPPSKISEDDAVLIARYLQSFGKR